MALASGTKLGPYEVQSPLGAGGMGEVYCAKDTRLERTVAIKTLPVHLSADPVRKQRFEREAKIISSLNHPHICVLHDIGHQDGIDYLVMEYVEGETLAKRLQKGPLPLEQVLKFGAQIADALDKAHRSGVVHRDLKPGNIVLAATGVKLLDFGLAKPVSPVVSEATLTAASKSSTPMTEEGTIVGTFRYMSPEQVEGKEVDGRSDLFSLGAVLYEMVTGKRAFEGKSQLSVASAILEKEPAPITSTKPLTPPALDHAIRKCLAKPADERWQSAGDLASELRWISESSAYSGMAPPSARKIREALAWLVSGILLVAIILGALWLRNPKPPAQALHFYAPLPFPARDVAVSPNGHTVAVVGYLESARKNAIWIYELGSQKTRSLTDTEGAAYPFWSPDGQSLGFFSDGKLKKVDLSSGSLQIICDAPSGRGGTWNKDGVIVFTPDAALGKGLYRVLASGGVAMQVSQPDVSRGESSHRWPMFLPDQRHFLYMAADFTGRKGVDAIFVGALDSKEKRFVVEASANAAYASLGYLLFPRGKTLFVQRFDVKRFALTGDATPILADIQYQGQVKRAVFDVSDAGFLVAQTGEGVALSQLVWYDRKGKEIGAAGQPDVYGNVSIAPNGRSVAVDKTDTGSLYNDIWTYDLLHDSAKRLTFGSGFRSMPIWSPDATRLVFTFNRREFGTDLDIKNSDGAEEEKTIVSDDFTKYANDWSRDGKYILYTRGEDLFSVTTAELKSSLFLKAASALRNGQFSPDGKWAAYASNETGKWEIYVTSFPDAHGKWQVSTGGGEQPRWRSDGKELFYLSLDGKIMAVPVTVGATFDSGSPIALFQATPRQSVSRTDLFVYDVRRDGQQFLVNTQVKQQRSEPMTVVLNWPAKLSR